MVWVRIGGPRRRGGLGGYGSRYGGGYGRGYGGHPRRRDDGGGCLRDLLLLNTGCCAAQALGCGTQAVLLAPTALVLALQRPEAGESRAVRLVLLYQSRISARRARGCCRMTPSCSNYALGALRKHGTARGLRLTLARLLRCRPGGPRGLDAVPAAAPAA